jgi:DNA polymerase elongation subunit (family B)
MSESKVNSTFKILDFDLETIAAGFADPEWVPQKITCAAWSWVGEKEVKVEVCSPLGLFGKPQLRAKMLEPLIDAINEAGMLTGHNLLRFDLPILQAECLRLGLTPLKPQLVQDTMRIVKTKGFKKGQDNLGALLKTKEQKLHLGWQNWEDAYDEKDWATIKERAASDVVMHKELREIMIENGWLKKPTIWNPRR